MSAKPITPDDLLREKCPDVLPEVIEVFNLLISKHWDGASATIDGRNAYELVRQKMKANGRADWERFRIDGFQVLQVFSAAGWEGKYDQKRSLNRVGRHGHHVDGFIDSEVYRFTRPRPCRVCGVL